MEYRTPYIFHSTEGRSIKWSLPLSDRSYVIDGVETVPGDLIDIRRVPRIVGIDMASGPDRTVFHTRVKGAQFVCAVPPELGAVTKMEIISGRVVAHTESGIDMIVPQARGDSTSR